ncbi:MAG: alpha amylase catalytic region, partial [Conexibacter sp.]|nr:alpha amylase catalytic region [Conexibacter sp.]
PLPWAPPSQAGPGAGFTTGTPWLPMTADAERRNAAGQAEDPRSVLTLYRRLLALRRADDDLQGGEIAFAEPHDPDVLAYRRGAGHGVALNFSAEARDVRWPAGARTLLSTHLDRDEGAAPPSRLRGGEGVVVTLS